MFVGILQRMVFRELTKVFVLCLVGVTGIVLMATVVVEASQQGLSPAQILAIIPLVIPSMLPYTIPATTLFATCVVYGRLTHDNEILAIRASGVNLLTVVWPGLLLGVLMGAATAALYFHVIPRTHHLMRTMFINDVEELLYARLSQEKLISHPQLPYSMYIQEVQGRRLINPIFYRRDEFGRIDMVASAREAELRVDVNNRVLKVLMVDGVARDVNGGASAYFDNKIWEVPLPDEVLDEKNRRARAMTWEELLRRRAELRKEHEELQTQIALLTSRLLLPPFPPDLPVHLNNLKVRAKGVRGQFFSLGAEIQMRPALSVGCVCFVLIGCPVGIWFSRSDYLSSFITCFLPVVFLYYPLILCGTDLAKGGKFDPVLTIWAADVVVAAVGVVLFWRLLKH